MPQKWYDLWEKTGKWWKPDERLVLAMINTYVTYSHLVPRYVADIGETIAYSVEREFEKTRIRYKTNTTPNKDCTAANMNTMPAAWAW